jgi:hypothetical protein
VRSAPAKRAAVVASASFLIGCELTLAHLDLDGYPLATATTEELRVHAVACRGH